MPSLRRSPRERCRRRRQGALSPRDVRGAAAGEAALGGGARTSSAARGAGMQELGRACARRSPRAAARAAWCWRCTTSRSRASRATALASPFFRKYLRGARRAAAAHRRRSPRRSACGATRAPASAPSCASGGRFKLDKDATTGSYARARRRPARDRRRDADAPPSDQVLVLVRKGDRTLTQTDDLGHAGHARHVQPGLQADVLGPRASRSCRARSPTRRRRRWSRTRTSCGRRVWLGIATRRGRRARPRSCAPRRARRPASCRRRRPHLARALGRAAARCATACTARPPSSTRS